MIKKYRFHVANILQQADNARRDVDLLLAKGLLLLNDLVDVGEDALEAVLDDFRLLLRILILSRCLDD